MPHILGPPCDNDDSKVDSWGYTCSTYYDLHREDCGKGDTATFNASDLCCKCKKPGLQFLTFC